MDIPNCLVKHDAAQQEHCVLYTHLHIHVDVCLRVHMYACITACVHVVRD